MIGPMNILPAISASAEKDIRKTFEDCLMLLKKTGDTIGRVETHQRDKALCMVAIAVGDGITQRATRALDLMMERGERRAQRQAEREKKSEVRWSGIGD